MAHFGRVHDFCQDSEYAIFSERIRRTIDVAGLREECKIIARLYGETRAAGRDDAAGEYLGRLLMVDDRIADLVCGSVRKTG